MSNNSKTPQATNQEKTEVIFTKLLNWNLIPEDDWLDDIALIGQWKVGNNVRADLIHNNFKPYTEWNDTHTVLEAVMKDEELLQSFLRAICWDGVNMPNYNETIVYMKATQQELMDTVYSLLADDQ